MPCGRTQHDSCCFLIIRGDKGANQAAPSHPGQFDGLILTLIRHHRTDRSKRFNRVCGFVGKWLIAVQEGGGKERPFFAVCTDHIEFALAAMHDLIVRGQFINGFPDIFNLVGADQRAHSHAFNTRVSNGCFVQSCLECFNHGLCMFLRYDGPADGSAFLTGLDGHFLRHRFDKQIKFACTWSGLGTEYGAIQRIGLHIERDAVGDDIGVGFEHATGGRRAGKCHAILLV